MTPFSIRRATVEDIPEIQRVGIDADTRFVDVGRADLADGTTIPTDAAERAIAAGRLLVAVSGSELAGWVYVGRIAGELCVGHLCVATRWGRRGIGSALLRRVKGDARAAGEPSIVLETQTDVGWGQPFYERHGFTVVPRDAWSPALIAVTETQIRNGLDWSTRVHMRLRLDVG